MAFIHSPKIVTDGLVLVLDAANNKSYPGNGTAWNNLVTTDVTASLLNGPPTFNSQFGGSLVFDGTNDKGIFTSPVASNASQSYEMWVRAFTGSSAANGFGYLLHNNSTDNIIGTAAITIGYAGPSGLQTGEIFAVFNGDFTAMGTGVTGSLNTVNHIVLTWDKNVQRVYVDGIQRKSASLTVSSLSGFSTNTSFADYALSTYRPISGSIYSIKVYNKALTAAEVLQNYNAVRSRFGV
jgi:hypothetical protein